MDGLITAAVNDTYGQVLRRARRLQWSFLLIGLALAGILTLDFDGWVPKVVLVLHKGGEGFLTGLQDPKLVAWFSEHGPPILVAFLLWSVGLFIALVTGLCFDIAEWLWLHIRKPVSVAHTIPISGPADRAFAQLLLRECLTSNGIFTLAPSIDKKAVIQYPMRVLRCSLFFAFVFFVLIGLRFYPWH